MTADIILTIVMGACLIIWMIICIVYFVLNGKNTNYVENQTVQLKCKKCNNTFEAPVEVIRKPGFTVKVSATRTKMVNGAAVNQPNYKYYARKLNCPYCNKSRLCQVLNINEIASEGTKLLIPVAIKTFVLMFAGGMIIMLLFSIPISIVRQQRINKIEEQYYEDFKERYGIDR